MKLSEILKQLRHIYTGRIGAEFAHVSTGEERLWLQDEFQLGRMQARFTADEQRNILWQLTAAEGLERELPTVVVEDDAEDAGDALPRRGAHDPSSARATTSRCISLVPS